VKFEIYKILVILPCVALKRFLLSSLVGALFYIAIYHQVEAFTRFYSVFFFGNCVYCFTLSLAEITLLDNNIIIYKFVQDLHFFVTGGDDENEIILASVLQGFFDSITLLLRYSRLFFLSRF